MLTNIGFAYHADFMMGWDEDFLQQAVKTCTNPSGRIEDCPLFNVVDQGTATSCKLENPLPKTLLAEVKDLLSPMASLPGNLPMFGDGGNPSETEVDIGSTSAAAPSLSYTAGEKPTDAASPLPGQVFKQVDNDDDAESSSAPAPAPAPAPTTASAPVAAAAAITEAPSATPTFFSTQYVTNGNTVSEIFWMEELVTVTKTVDAAETAAPAQRRRSHLHAHARKH